VINRGARLDAAAISFDVVGSPTDCADQVDRVYSLRAVITLETAFSLGRRPNRRPPVHRREALGSSCNRNIAGQAEHTNAESHAGQRMLFLGRL